MKEKVEELIIIGMGEHGKVVLDTLLSKENKRFNILGYLDDNICSPIYGIPFLGNIEDCSKYIHKKFHIAIGNNSVRKNIAKKIGIDKLVSIIHDKAFVSKFSKIENGTYIGAMVVVNQGCSIGENCIINTGSIIEHGTKIGNNCHLSYGVLIGSDCELCDELYVEMGKIIEKNMKVGERNCG